MNQAKRLRMLITLLKRTTEKETSDKEVGEKEDFSNKSVFVDQIGALITNRMKTLYGDFS